MCSQAKISSSPRADEAMGRYADGDAAAGGEVYDCLAGRLYAYLLRRTNDLSVAEDLLQQTFLRIHRERGQFTPGAQVVPWAFRIADNLATDMWRKSQRRKRLAWRLPTVAEDPWADAELAATELACRLDQRLDRLPKSQRTAFELRRLDGLTLRETAQACGTTVASVKQLVHRAQRALRDVLELEETEESV